MLIHNYFVKTCTSGLFFCSPKRASFNLELSNECAANQLDASVSSPIFCPETCGTLLVKNIPLPKNDKRLHLEDANKAANIVRLFCTILRISLFE